MYLYSCLNRVRSSPHKMKLLTRWAEPLFGIIQRARNQGTFLTEGLESAGAKMSLTILAYNIQRAIKVLGEARMAETLA